MVGETMITWLFIGCMSVHKVGTLAEYESTADLTRNADRPNLSSRQ